MEIKSKIVRFDGIGKNTFNKEKKQGYRLKEMYFEQTNLYFLCFVDTLLIVSNIKVIFHVEKFVDVCLLLTCHLVISVILFHSATCSGFQKSCTAIPTTSFHENNSILYIFSI